MGIALKQISKKTFIYEVSTWCESNVHISVNLHKDPYIENELLVALYDIILFQYENNALYFEPLDNHSRDRIKIAIKPDGKFYHSEYKGTETYRYEDSEYSVNIEI